MRRVTFSADDFGLSKSVNQAVELGFRDGVLTHASLMVSGAAAGDAVERAHNNPGLKVGLHLVVVEGPATLPHHEIPGLTDSHDRFPSDQLRLGINYFFRSAVRRQLRAEIIAQFRAFAATGLTLDHADAHKHMHLHPTVGRLMLEIGREFGLSRIRVPAEPPAVLRALGEHVSIGDQVLFHWCALLRRQARRFGVATNDQVFGLHWSGHMTEARVLKLLDLLPEGDSEIYFHPALARDEVLRGLMPAYEHEAELAALMSPLVAERVVSLN